MTKNTFKIVVGKAPYDSHVFLNGVELEQVVRVSFDIDGRRPEASMLKIEIMGQAVVDGEFVEVPIVNIGPQVA